MMAFQSTGPLRDPTEAMARTRTAFRYFNPQVPCGTRHVVILNDGLEFKISIHRSLAGPDDVTLSYEFDLSEISIHRSLAGPDDNPR